MLYSGPFYYGQCIYKQDARKSVNSLGLIMEGDYRQN
jgi:hypothetical protein